MANHNWPHPDMSWKTRRRAARALLQGGSPVTAEEIQNMINQKNLQIGDLNTKITTEQANLSAKNEEKRQLVQQLKFHTKQRDGYVAALGRLNKEKVAKEAERNSIAFQIPGTNQWVAKNPFKDTNKLVRLSQEINTYNTTIANTTGRVNSSNEQIRQLSQAIAGVNFQINNLEGSLSQAKEDKSQLGIDISSLKNQKLGLLTKPTRSPPITMGRLPSGIPDVRGLATLPTLPQPTERIPGQSLIEGGQLADPETLTSVQYTPEGEMVVEKKVRYIPKTEALVARDDIPRIKEATVVEVVGAPKMAAAITPPVPVDEQIVPQRPGPTPNGMPTTVAPPTPEPVVITERVYYGPGWVREAVPRDFSPGFVVPKAPRKPAAPPQPAPVQEPGPALPAPPGLPLPEIPLDPFQLLLNLPKPPGL